MLSADLRQRIRTYLEQQAAHHDAEAIALLDAVAKAWPETKPLTPAPPQAENRVEKANGEDRVPGHTRDHTAAATLAEDLFHHWRARAEAEVGASFWSYPVPLEDLAQDLAMPAAELRSHIARWGRADCQVVDGRDSRSATVAFHPAPKRREVPPSDFQVGDRVRVTAQRPQYANCTGVITQTISVSCRVQLDNGWQAFLPYHCLEKLTAES